MNNEKQIQKNEQDIIVQKQLEWVKSLSLEELRKTFYASRYLTWTGNFFHLVSAAMLIITLMIIGGAISNSGGNQKTILGMGLCLIILILSFSNKLNRFTGIARKIYIIIQTMLALGFLYFAVLAIAQSPMGEIATNESAKSKVLDGYMFLAFAIFTVMIIAVTETIGQTLCKNRTCAAKNSLLIESVLFTAVSLFSAIQYRSLAVSIIAIIVILLMAGIIFICGISKTRNMLFGDYALSHKQLQAVLEQKKQSVQNENIVIPEDFDKVTHRWGGIATLIAVIAAGCFTLWILWFAMADKMSFWEFLKKFFRFVTGG